MVLDGVPAGNLAQAAKADKVTNDAGRITPHDSLFPAPGLQVLGLFRGILAVGPPAGSAERPKTYSGNASRCRVFASTQLANHREKREKKKKKKGKAHIIYTASFAHVQVLVFALLVLPSLVTLKKEDLLGSKPENYPALAFCVDL